MSINYTNYIPLGGALKSANSARRHVKAQENASKKCPTHFVLPSRTPPIPSPTDPISSAHILLSRPCPTVLLSSPPPPGQSRKPRMKSQTHTGVSIVMNMSSLFNLQRLSDRPAAPHLTCLANMRSGCLGFISDLPFLFPGPASTVDGLDYPLLRPSWAYPDKSHCGRSNCGPP